MDKWFKSFRDSGGGLGFYHRDKAITDTYTVHTNKVLGVGVSGPVVKATLRNGGDFAVKKLEMRSCLSDDAVEEVKIFASLNHPNVVKLVEVFDNGFELYLVMELLTGGELFERVANRGAYSEVDAAAACGQMCQAIDYLHTRPAPIVHFDLKPENWLYLTPTSDQLKLVDFGRSVEWNKQGKHRSQELHFTPEYAAPEVLQCSEYTEKCDIFSLGVILYILLTGNPPFTTATDFNKYRPLAKSRFLKLSEEAKLLLTSTFSFEPTQRPSAQDILEGDWCKAANKGTVGEPMDPEVITGIRASHFRRVCLNMLAWSTTAKDTRELQKCFADSDTEKVGKLCLSEFRRVLEEKLSIDGVEATQLFASIQREDNPGELNYTEFLSAVMRQRLRLHQNSLYSLWTTLSGSDSDGAISITNLQSMLEGFDAADRAALIQEMHPTSAGEISFQSFQDVISRLLTPPKADLGGADEEQQRKFVEMAVRLIDDELGADSEAVIHSWPPCRSATKMMIPSLAPHGED